MKKALSLFLVLLLTAVAVSGCTTPESKAEGPAKIGLAILTTIDGSKDKAEAEDGTVTLPSGDIESVMAIVAFDKDGKVLKATIDTSQTSVKFDEDLNITSDLNEKGKTKVELKDGYNMRRVSTIDKEWFEQIAEFENWMVGKTVSEITGLKVKARDENHIAVPDIPELTSLVTVTVQDYLAAVKKAWDNAVEVSEGGFSLGLGHDISIASSVSKSDGVLPLAQVDNIIAGTLFDKDGKVVKTIIDTAQTKVEFDENGVVTSDRNAAIESKKELKEKYNMARVSGIGKEWYEQATELENWMAGKSIDEIKNMTLTEKDAPDVAELTSLVTMSVSGYVKTVAESFENAIEIAQ